MPLAEKTKKNGHSPQRGSDYLSFAAGISLGCPLSPLMGALFLGDLDEAVAR